MTMTGSPGTIIITKNTTMVTTRTIGINCTRRIAAYRMSIAETEQAKPLRLRVVTVTPGDTIEKLAGKMALADRALDRFRVLNGLDPSDRLKPGSEVKIVVE